ncbi:uncharacterized protein ACIBXB_021557 isoform 2-T2 [Morphnus guianensis]
MQRPRLYNTFELCGLCTFSTSTVSLRRGARAAHSVNSAGRGPSGDSETWQYLQLEMAVFKDLGRLSSCEVSVLASTMQSITTPRKAEAL